MSDRSPLAWTAIAALLVMTAYEALKQSLFPGLTPWQSHAITIAFVTALAVIAAQLTSKRLVERETIARQRSEKSEATLRAFINALPEPAFLAEADLRFVATNSALARSLGKTSEELVGVRFTDLIDNPNVVAQRQSRFDEVVRTRERIVFADERDGRHFVNHLVPVLGPDGEVSRVAVFAIDVTSIRKAEEALRAREEQLRLAFEAARLRVWEWDPVADRLSIVADELQHPTFPADGVTVGTLDSWLDKVAPADRSLVTKALRECAARDGESVPIAYRVMMEDGTPRSRELRARSFSCEGEQRRRVIGTVMDTTERQKLEDEIRSMNVELERRVAERTAELASANEELESFCYSVSHDLRAPLRSIDGFAHALLDDCGDRLDERGKQHLGIVQSETKRMGQLIDDLLRLSQVTRSAMKRASVDLSALAREATSALQRLDPNRRTEVVLEKDLTTNGDAGLLRIVLDNLIGNAWKFSARRNDARIEIGAVIEDGRRAFFVRDNGVGFEMQYAQRLFEPFQRLHRSKEFAGTGIGLATVHRIVTRHGGKVWADAKPNDGACFFFTLAEEH